MSRLEYLSGESAALASDDWRAVSNLLGYPSSAKVYLREGFLNVQGNPATFRLVAEGAPVPSGSTGGGLQRVADSISGLGPASGIYRGYPIHRLYVRNTTAGSNATLAIEGVAEVE